MMFISLPKEQLRALLSIPWLWQLWFGASRHFQALVLDVQRPLNNKLLLGLNKHFNFLPRNYSPLTFGWNSKKNNSP
jgi:hypothetical protein